ncbi:hypothetical protein [Orientia tsutsugamushi]|uniref:hypothetical protein n=1 Tax=Orientia tsutsugamushi TaxID=784 RepID=UPI00123A55E8|nr:hypothetical protein [Orientia tsutsugamushi]QES95925.1 hypothetical protein F0363_03405 [Orientia tsutsugamushi]
MYNDNSGQATSGMVNQTKIIKPTIEFLLKENNKTVILVGYDENIYSDIINGCDNYSNIKAHTVKRDNLYISIIYHPYDIHETSSNRVYALLNCRKGFILGNKGATIVFNALNYDIQKELEELKHDERFTDNNISILDTDGFIEFINHKPNDEDLDISCAGMIFEAVNSISACVIL